MLGMDKVCQAMIWNKQVRRSKFRVGLIWLRMEMYVGVNLHGQGIKDCERHYWEEYWLKGNLGKENALMVVAVLGQFMV